MYIRPGALAEDLNDDKCNRFIFDRYLKTLKIKKNKKNRRFTTYILKIGGFFQGYH